MRRRRRNHSATFKAEVALAAVRGDRTLLELAEQFKVHPNQIGQWRAELLEPAAEVFATAAERREPGPDLKTLHAKTGQLALENDLLAGALTAAFPSSSPQWFPPKSGGHLYRNSSGRQQDDLGMTLTLYLRHVLERIADHQIHRIGDLLPWRVPLPIPAQRCA